VCGSTTAPQAPGSPARFTVTVPRLDGTFTGTGDLFASVLLARISRDPTALAPAVEATVASVQAVLAGTLAAAGDAALTHERSAAVCAARELRLVQCQGAIQRPEVTHRAVPFA